MGLAQGLAVRHVVIRRAKAHVIVETVFEIEPEAPDDCWTPEVLAIAAAASTPGSEYPARVAVPSSSG